MNSKKEVGLGIDLGTTNSCVASIIDGKTTVQFNKEGKNTTPSVVSFKNEGGKIICLFGQAAVREMQLNVKYTIYGAKRLIGRKYEEIKHLLKYFPYNVVEDEDGYACIEIYGEKKRPEYISSLLLNHLVGDAYSSIGQARPSKAKVVITYPAYFDDTQRSATKLAGTLANLEVVDMVSEPTAAALAYFHGKDIEGTILIFDLGGGTFDVSLLNYTGGLFEVYKTGGDPLLGGDDFDNILTDYVMADFKKKNNIDLSNNAEAKYRIKEAAREAKERLSSAQSTNITISYICEGPKHIDMTITRQVFEGLIDHLLEKSIKITEEVINDAIAKEQIKSKNDISKVVLVGGSTRIPKIAQLVRQRISHNVHADINPDEVVGVGAAVKCGMSIGSVQGLVLVDVTPLDIGIETLGGMMTVIMPANTKIPYKTENEFTTTTDNQTEVEICVYQGNRPMAKYNKLLGKYRLSGITPAPRGAAKIVIAVSINTEGILEVSARDPSAPNAVITGEDGKQIGGKIEINVAGGALDKELIAQMKKEAEEQRERDMEEVSKAQIRNDIINISHEINTMCNKLTGMSSEHASYVADVQQKLKAYFDESNNTVAINDLKEIEGKYRSLFNEVDKYFKDASEKKGPDQNNNPSQDPQTPTDDNNNPENK